MSRLHPIIAVTGSSGAGTSTAKKSFDHIFHRQNIRPMVVAGDSFHRYARAEMRERMNRSAETGSTFSHFAYDANLLDELESMFRSYSEVGAGKQRHYVHDQVDEDAYGCAQGTFSEWVDDAGSDTDLMLYEGLHGAVVNKDVNVARYADLLIGVVPIVNLEWIQKIHRDTQNRGYEAQDVTDTILRRMYDYVNVITPQFSLTDINFQRVPMVDTSNPFIARDIPTLDESMVVIRFRDPKKFNIDFPYLLSMLEDSFMSRRNTIVVPGGKMGMAMEVILHPIIEHLMVEKREALML